MNLRSLFGVERPTNRWATWFRRAMWVGIVQDWALGLPAIFAPEKTLKVVRQRPTRDPVWTSFAALMTVLISFLYIPGAQDPYRYRASAVLSVLARPPGVLFFLVLRRRVYPLCGIIDGVLFSVQGPLLLLALREGPPEEGTVAPAPGREAMQPQAEVAT